MPRFYKRKEGAKPRTPVNGDNLKKAVEMVVGGGTIKGTAKHFGLSVMTLKRYVRKYTSNKEILLETNYKQRQILTKEEEDLLCNYLERASKLHHGLTQLHLKQLAFQFSVKNNKEVPDNWRENECASYEWYRGFMNRHPKLALRAPESTSLSRSISFNRHNVGQFFDNLQIIYNREKLEPQNIWNIDESGLTTVHKPGKIIAIKGVKQVGKVTSAERGQLVTICASINASGNTIPPFMIFPRVNWQDRMLKGTPPGTDGSTYPSGWMTTGGFIKFLCHFKHHVKCTKDNPVLMIMDNHDTHISIESLNYAKNNGIIMLTIPPHTSHKLQPLDKAIFGPLKAYYNVAAQDWMSNHPGKPITIYDIGELVGIAFPKATTPVNVYNGFKATGIWPLNRNIFSDDDYLPSHVTDRPLNLQEISNGQGSSAQPSAENTEDVGPVSNTTPDQLPMSPFQTRKILYTPEDIRPHPKASPHILNKSKRGRKKGSTKILTDTPIKGMLIKDLEKKQAKKNCKRKKLCIKSHLKAKKKILQDTSSSDENDSYSLHDSTEDEFYPDLPNEDKQAQLDDPCLNINDFAIVRFATKKRVIHYVGQIERKVGFSEFEISFLKRKGTALNQFIFPEQKDKSVVDESDCVKLPHPVMLSGTLRNATTLMFDFDFSYFENIS